MHTTALLSFLSLWTEMAAVHAGKIETESTACGQLITVRATGSELMSTADSSCEPKEKDAARLGDSAVSGDFLAVGNMISLQECDSELYGTSGSAASCMYPAGENIPLRSIDIIRCAAATHPATLQRATLFVH
eukprot:SAG11_NODE_6207_length_1364_cov_83.256917_2_plen_133_part_00